VGGFFAFLIWVKIKPLFDAHFSNRVLDFPQRLLLVRLSSSEIDHIALLARLDLSPAERERAATELSQILEHFEQLAALDTENVEPTSHVMPVVNVLRRDEVRPGLTLDAVLQNAPEHAAGQFQVPRVVEAE